MAKATSRTAPRIAKAKREKVVLAYSGGLDTSVIVRWLEQQGYDVICYCANVGQVEKYDDLKQKALNSGGSKCYIGDLREEFVRDFVGTVADAGCTVFIVHARNAWLQGLSPKQNREVPPLRHDTVYRLKRDFPALTIVLNGGVTCDADIEAHLAQVDGVMVGREAYHQPWLLSGWDRRFFGDTSAPAPDRDLVEAQMVDYMDRVAASGEPWSHVSRHMLGLRHGLPGARHWRQVWSDHRLKDWAPARVSQHAALSVALAPRQHDSRGVVGAAPPGSPQPAPHATL